MAIFVVLGGALASAPLAAESSSTGDLAASCAQALTQGYNGLEAEACNWYVAPCPVCGGATPPPPAWCAPADTASATLAAEFVAGLRRQPALATQSPRDVVKTILAARYPCH